MYHLRFTLIQYRSLPERIQLPLFFGRREVLGLRAGQQGRKKSEGSLGFVETGNPEQCLEQYPLTVQWIK